MTVALVATDKRAQFARFVVRYGDATRAALAAGYARTSAGNLMQDQRVIDEIERLQATAIQSSDITAQRVMKELARIAFSDVRNAFDENGHLKPIHELSDDEAAVITGVEYETTARVVKRKTPEYDLVTGEEIASVGDVEILQVRTAKIKRADKNTALSTLAKHFKLVNDEGDGVNALANALADRLKGARRRVDLVEEVQPPQLPE